MVTDLACLHGKHQDELASAKKSCSNESVIADLKTQLDKLRADSESSDSKISDLQDQLIQSQQAVARLQAELAHQQSITRPPPHPRLGFRQVETIHQPSGTMKVTSVATLSPDSTHPPNLPVNMTPPAATAAGLSFKSFPNAATDSPVRPGRQQVPTTESPVAKPTFSPSAAAVGLSTKSSNIASTTNLPAGFGRQHVPVGSQVARVSATPRHSRRLQSSATADVVAHAVFLMRTALLLYSFCGGSPPPIVLNWPRPQFCRG